jgi:hypothetical protein
MLGTRPWIIQLPLTTLASQLLQPSSSLLLPAFESNSLMLESPLYLHLYPEKIGVQHYITNKVKRFPLAEIGLLQLIIYY